ncbi:MAG: O-antigen ligase family protein, partial [Bacteroidota bacterium]
DEANLKTSLQTLSVAVLLALMFLFASVCWEVVFDLQLPISSTLSSGLYFNHQFSKPLAIHAGYLSLYVALAIVFIIRSYKRQNSIQNKMLVLGAVFILFVGLFFLASRNAILVVSFILLFVMPFFRLKKKLWYFSVVLILIALTLSVLNKVPYLKQRFSSEMVMDLNSNIGFTGIENFKVLEPRFDRWLAALDLVKHSPILGYGTGDEEAMLKTAYIHNGLYISYILEFNAHNQYLSILIKHGIIGLLILLLSLLYYLKLAVQSRDFMYLSFLLLIGIGFFTENILDANKGIFFFAVFNTFFGYKCLMKGNSRNRL